MSKETVFDFIVVGSGPSGAIAAKTLCDRNFTVLMLDVGNKDEIYKDIVPNENYEEIRRHITEQHRFFLGDELEAIPQTEVKVGAQLSPSRKAMIKDVEELIPLISSQFKPMESLGLGGLGAGWGLGSYVYSEQECVRAGLSFDEMNISYQYVADHIGISGGEDDLSPFVLGNLKQIQKSLQVDNATKRMFDNYEKNKSFFTKNKMYFGAAAMAILTENKGKRKATEYQDMDFYTDQNQSAYRPQFTIEELNLLSNFSYTKSQLVTQFIDSESQVEVQSIDSNTQQKNSFFAKKIILATGALGTARIVMRSLPSIKRLPILSNPYAYLPGIQWSMLGKKLSKNKSSMAQAMMIYDPNSKNDDLVSLAFYTYQSLMLFRLIKESPLNLADNRIIFQFLQSAFVIAGMHHPDSFSEEKYLTLEANPEQITGDEMKAYYALSDEEKAIIKAREKKIRKAIIKLGIFPIKKIDPGPGSSIHYAGTLPFSQNEELGKQSPKGRVYGTNNVYVADSSGFTFLPAKGVTLSIMANAHRVVKQL